MIEHNLLRNQLLAQALLGINLLGHGNSSGYRSNSSNDAKGYSSGRATGKEVEERGETAAVGVGGGTEEGGLEKTVTGDGGRAMRGGD